ncbi:alpha/beta fold hydrolase [Rhodovulum strictum]|uniref:Alpha/beta fold hydrolase n=1 Tax=Rhodovulum strictum TaxID=58314 RepID=A0A844B7X4_9RHOB|nr:alpha/beta fold hydrolase [Rhodovulum strictum]MRH22476.1 alpha/beta fold hydrolase [Rhodovulum strictum]
MTEFLLVHGSNHGAWCWRDVLPLLRAAGHDARAIDLPGAGADPTPPETVTLSDYRDAVLAALTRPAILVGHSLGGITITAAGAAAPDRIEALVFVAAWAPRPGQSARDLRAHYRCESLLAAFRMSADRKTSTFAEESLEPVFYHDCPSGTADFARPRLTPQPTAPGTEPAAALPARLPRHYVICTADRAIPPAAQEDMTRDWPPAQVHRLETGHSPFFAAPDRLAQILIAIAETK